MNSFGFYNVPYWGQRISAASGETYVVQNGDSLYKIAKKYGVTVEELMNANNLTNSLIYPNQVIVIPKKINNGAVFFEEYIIMDGDTLEGIALKTQSSTSDIVRYNDITKLMLVPMQNINIPTKYRQYEIVATDDLEAILKKTGMTVEELIKANAENWLKPGNVINVK